jgi:pimeloyl-ACP methyl ester carboxylesterase
LLYAATPASPEQPPLIVIPGAFGSRLRDTATGRSVWPGSTARLLLSDFDDIEVALDPDTLEPAPSTVVADGLFTDGIGRDYYGRLLHTLQSAGGYRVRKAGDRPQVGERNLYVFTYDWRGDSVTAAHRLYDLVERIRRDYGDAHLRVDVVAHSIGGLIARYLARYGPAPLPASGLPAATARDAPCIRRLVTIGTPNLGTIQPVLSHIRGEEVGLGRIAQDVVATCAGVLQVMPHERLPWALDVEGRALARSVYAIETWRELGWSVFDPAVRDRAAARHGDGARGRAHLAVLERYFAKCLERARAFSNALAAPASANDVAPFVFGADCTPTLARIVVEHVNGRAVARERPGDVVNVVPGVDYRACMFLPGDRVVTRESLLGRCAAECAFSDALRIEHSVFLCEEHQALTGNPSFQNNLLYTLLSA